MAFINRRNKVPEYQRFYQAAFRNHVRTWKIHPRSNLMLTPYYILLAGTASVTVYAAFRKVLGHNTFFGDD